MYDSKGRKVAFTFQIEFQISLYNTFLLVAFLDFWGRRQGYRYSFDVRKLHFKMWNVLELQAYPFILVL